MAETKDLRAYLAPLLEFYGAGYFDKYVGISKQARNKWYTYGLPVSEIREPKRIPKIAELAEKQQGTRRITAKGLSKYIGNASGN